MKVGDLVRWELGYCDVPGLVLEIRPAKNCRSQHASISPTGLAVLAILPELGLEPEWFHERELETLSESR